MTNASANMPLVNIPFVDADGKINQTWFMFLVQLFRRTGGASGNDGSLTLADVLALEETFAPALPVGGIGGTGEVVPARAGARRHDPEMVVAMPSRAECLADMVFAPICAQLFTQTFESGPGFTPGTTTTLTLARSFSAVQTLLVFFDGTYQGDDQYQLSGNVLTFGAAIPVGVNNVYVKGVT